MAERIHSSLDILLELFQSNKITNLSPIIDIALTSPTVFMDAVKFSKLFIRKKSLYDQLKILLQSENTLQEFFAATDAFTQHYEQLESAKKSYREQIYQFGYLDLLCLASLYLMKNASLHTTNPFTIDTHDHILSTIIQERIEQPDRKKYSIDEYYIQEKFTKYFLSPHAPKELVVFEDIVHCYKESYLFETNILDTYCFDDNYQFTIHDQYIQLSPIDVEKYIQWYVNGQKLEIMQQYYIERASYKIGQEANDAIFGKPENHILNKSIVILTESLFSYLTEQFGVEETLPLEKNIQLSLYPVLHGLSAIIGLYQNQFVETYIKFQQETNDWWHAWQLLLAQSIFKGKDRLPLLYDNMGDFGLKISQMYQLNSGQEIENFWTYNLNELRDNTQKVPNLFEKPLLRIGDYTFKMPWLIGFQNPTTSFANNLLRVYHRRNAERKDEVHRSEQDLAALLQDNGFVAEAGHITPDGQNIEFDVIAFKDGHLFILELKSTYIRTTLRDAWLYKYRNLNKASEQLAKRENIIRKLLDTHDSSFINRFGIPEHIHLWIVDTSFEFDHEIFDDYLKISMFELIHSIINLGEKSMAQFVSEIETNLFWEKHLAKQNIPIESITYRFNTSQE